MRARQAELFDSTVALTRDAPLGAFNATTAGYAPAAPLTVYAGPALVRPASAGEHAAVAGDASEELDAYMVKLPAGTDARVGDVATATASTYDPALVGKPMRVMQVAADEWQVTRRCYAVARASRPA
jgi:hypothetical protein